MDKFFLRIDALNVVAGTFFVKRLDAVLVDVRTEGGKAIIGYIEQEVAAHYAEADHAEVVLLVVHSSVGVR